MITAAAFVLAAAIGAVVRLLLREWARADLPVGTLVANLSGCFLLGCVAGWSPPAATVVGTAGIGALTTYSTFAAEIVHGWPRRRGLIAAYVAVSVVGGIGLAWIGLQVGS